MASLDPGRMVGAVEFIETASRQRAACYRERATQLLVMAEAEPIGTLRGNLLELAAQYETLAENLEISRDG